MPWTQHSREVQLWVYTHQTMLMSKKNISSNLARRRARHTMLGNLIAQASCRHPHEWSHKICERAFGTGNSPNKVSGIPGGHQLQLSYVSAANIPVTPSTHRQRPGPDGFGISAVPGLVAGTPVALHGSGRMRQPPLEMQHTEHTSTDNFTGVGLSSRLKASQASGTYGAFVPAARPHGKLSSL